MTPTTQPAEHTKLLPCPFCGGTHLEVIFYNTPCVVCHDCYANGAQAERLRVDIDNRPETAEQARQLWNRRAGNPAPESAIEQAREALKATAAFLNGDPECRDLEDTVRAALSALTPATDKQG